MENKRIWGTAAVLGFIAVLSIFTSTGDNAITGKVVGDVAKGAGGIVVILIVILMLIIFVGEYDWISRKK